MEKTKATKLGFGLMRAYFLLSETAIQEGRVLFNNPYMPKSEEIEGLANYIIENNDRKLYNVAFAPIDRDLINKMIWSVENYRENSTELKELMKQDLNKYFANPVICTLNSLKAIHREIIDLDTYKNKYWGCETSTNKEGESIKDTSTGKENNLPVEFTENNPQIKKYIERAINCGMIQRTSTGGEWIYKGGTKTGNARLGYFCFKAFKEPRPQKAIQNFFGINDISPSITNASMEVKRSDVISWRKEIDDKIFYD